MKKYFNQTKRFRKDTLSAFYLKINEVLYCSQINPGLLFTARSTMFEVFTDLMNQVGCKSVPAHLFLCHRVFSQRQTCKMCTRIICYETTHSKILSKLYSKWILLNEFVTEAPEDLKRVFELMSCPNVSSFLSLNCFIGCTRLNDSVVPREKRIFLILTCLVPITWCWFLPIFWPLFPGFLLIIYINTWLKNGTSHM